MAEYDDTKVKDNIVVAISGAIKSLQLYSISSKDRSKDTPKVISNNNLQLHDLCIQLDRAFCHGLRAGKNGFWKYLHGVIPKKTVQEIEGLANVSSDIGKGRAWLHLILAESSLESYLRLFAKQNDIHKRKHYHRYALLCDIERMQLLETVASGLDAIQFVLDMDVPYLDSVDYSTPFVSGNVNNDDKLSNTPGFAKKKVLTSMGYVDCVVKSSESKSAVMSPANDNISPNAEVKKDKTAPEKLPQKEHPRLSSAPIPPMLQASITSSEHMADTVVSRNRKKKKNKSSKGTSQSSHDKSAKSHGDVITDDKTPTDVLDDKYLTTEENKNDFHAKEAPMDPVDSTSVTSKGELITKPSELLQTESDLQIVTDDNEIRSAEEIITIAFDNHEEILADTAMELPDNETPKMTNQTVENCQFLNDSTNAETLKSNDTIGFHVESEMDMKRSEQLTVTTDSLNPIDNSETPPKNNKLSDLLQSQDVLVETSLQNRHSTLPNDEVNELSVVEDHIITETEAKPDIESPNSDKEVDKYSTHNNDFGNAAATSTDGSNIDKDNEKTRSHSLSASENIPENILAFDFEINITPSIELELTLNTIDDEIESLCKMYKVPYFENTMFVNFQYLLLTDATIYMLYQDSGSYMKKLSFELDAIDHFVIGIDWQLLGIAIKSANYNKLNIYTLCELHGRAIIGELKKILSCRGLEPLIIYDKITELDKWIDTIEEKVVKDNSALKYIQFCCASNVASRMKPRKSTVTHNGWLEYYKPQGYFGRGQNWLKQYFCIQDGKLYHWLAKGDRHPKAILDLKECAECNLIPDSEKPFAFKIKMKDGSTSFALAAQDGESLRIWLTLLYENILTQNVWDRKNNAVCPGPGFVLGSLIITKTNVYICTTNTESEILKMISSCPIESIISVSKDKDGRIPYCCSLEYIIVESDESHSIPLCFATSFDCEKFIASITKEWRNLFKVDLSVGECEEYIIDTFNEYVEIFGESK